MINDTLKAIFARRSIRNFKSIPLTAEQIDTLAEVALASPTGMNRQPWLFHFITDPLKIEAISEAALNYFRQQGNTTVLDRMASRHRSLFYGAPLVIIISLPKDFGSQIDAGIAVENLAIAAQSMGLGSCIIGLAEAAFEGSQEESIARMIALPDSHEFAISIAIGQAAISKEAHERHPEKVIRIGID